MNTNDGYSKTMNEIWNIKELIYKETQNMNFSDYMENNIAELKLKFKNNYVISPPAVIPSHQYLKS